MSSCNIKSKGICVISIQFRGLKRLTTENHTIKSEGAKDGSTELYTASFGNTLCTNCLCELFYRYTTRKEKSLEKQSIQSQKYMNLLNEEELERLIT